MRRSLTRDMWRGRMRGVQRNVEVWQALLSVRSLVLPMQVWPPLAASDLFTTATIMHLAQHMLRSLPAAQQGLAHKSRGVHACFSLVSWQEADWAAAACRRRLTPTSSSPRCAASRIAAGKGPSLSKRVSSFLPAALSLCLAIQFVPAQSMCLSCFSACPLHQAPSWYSSCLVARHLQCIRLVSVALIIRARESRSC